MLKLRHVITEIKNKQDLLDVIGLYKSGKPLDVKLLKIHLEEVKGYKNIKIDEFINLMILLSYCGFNINFVNNIQ